MLKCKMLNWESKTCQRHKDIFNLMAVTPLKKLGQGHVDSCVAPVFL